MLKDITVVLVYEDREEWISRTNSNKILSRFLATKEEINIIYTEISKRFNVKLFEYPKNTYSEIYEFIDNNSNLIFWNLTDGFDIFIGSHIPSFATVLDKPYIGSSTYVQALCQNKHHLKTIIREFGIKTPNWLYFDYEHKQETNFNKLKQLNSPFFIKPATLDNSIGTEYITPFTDDITTIEQSIIQLFEKQITKVLVEEFVDGDEITVACLHLDEWKIIPLKQSYNGKYISSYSKEGCEGHIYAQEYYNKSSIILLVERILNILNIKDYCRMDFRFNKDELSLLEINTGTFLTTRPFSKIADIFFQGDRSEMFYQLIKNSFKRQS
ncbi:MAG: ATP-grasp domain-containing protein [Arcobacteraceae bacterium]